MKCPSHPTDDLSKEDFYWHRDGKGTLKNKLCKKCICKQNKEKFDEKKEFYKMFAV